jgi:hypothetical protein
LKLRWRQGLREATGYERMVLLKLERYAENIHLQEVVRGLCDASPIGIIDCAGLSARASIRRWGRYRGKVYVEFRVRASVPGACATYRFRCDNVRSTRPYSESSPNCPLKITENPLRFAGGREGWWSAGHATERSQID